jgi:AraC-like DNA-binding protein
MGLLTERLERVILSGDLQTTAHYPTALVPVLQEMLRARGLAPPPPVGSVRDIERFAEAASEVLDDPFVGLHAAEAVPRGAHGLAEFVGRSARTLRDGFNVFARYARLMNETMRVDLEARGPDLALHIRLASQDDSPRRHQTEFILANFVRMARVLVGKAWSPRAVWFEHARPRRVDELVRFLGTGELGFGGGSNGVLADAAALRQPVVSSDAELHQVLLSQADKELARYLPEAGFVGQVQALVTVALEKGPPRLSWVARQMHVGVRTFQRRLAAEGEQFETVLLATRKSLAVRYLEDPRLGLAEVAFRLGYANLAAFIRAFKRWTAQTPGEFRKQNDPSPNSRRNTAPAVPSRG